MSKNILITGCSTGFGFEAAKHLAGKGHHVYATMRGTTGKNAEAAEALSSYAASAGVQIDVLDLDVTSDESVNAAVAQVPTIDVLINNAGLGYGGPIEAFTTKQFEQQMDVNVTGTFRVASAVLPGMRAQRSGLIIQVSSVAGRFASPGFGIYHASKWALEGLSESWRYELAPLGIDVVLVEPGPFSTSFFANINPAMDEQLMADYAHVGQFSQGLGETFTALFEDENAPTDPMIVVQIFEDLIDAPNGTRPLRTLAGLDFGCQAINDSAEPLRKGMLDSFEIGAWDGPTAVAEEEVA